MKEKRLYLSSATALCALSLFSLSSCSEKTSETGSNQAEKKEQVSLAEMPKALYEQTYYLTDAHLQKKKIEPSPDFYLLYYTASW